VSSIKEVESGLCLKVMEGSHQQEIHDLTRTEISIGRATPETPYTPAYMTFPEPTLSRLHAVLKWDPKAKTYVAHHKSKTNPTLINGRHLTKSVVLTPGDTLALGRLVVVLDIAKSTGGRTEPLTPPPSATLQVNSLTSARSYGIPVDKSRIKLQFSDSRTTAAITPEESEDGVKKVRIAGSAANELSFLFAENETVKVETLRDEPITLRRTVLDCGVLTVPLRPGAQLLLADGDAIRHQEHEARLVKSGLQEFSESTLEGKSDTIDSEPTKSAPTKGGALLFLNGAWTGALLEVPESGLTAFELGPKSSSFLHPPPLSNTPTCRITVQDSQAQLRVTQVSDDQFVDVDGELFFAGESTRLSSGSRLLLGDAEFLWSVPSLHEIYSRFEIVEPNGKHSITKQRVRLGTAAHCEIRLKQPALAPVVGFLEFTEDEIKYHHLNIATPARVDGVDTSAGLSTQVRSGSNLELAPGITISLEELR
jgi:pSer/pThr/pTyr-binding forkhead associated (FHA) protein